MSWVNTHRMTHKVTRMQRECTINAQWRDAGRINCKSHSSLFSLPLFSSLQCAVLWSVGAPVIGIETWLAVEDNDVDGATTRSANRAVLHRFCIGCIGCNYACILVTLCVILHVFTKLILSWFALEVTWGLYRRKTKQKPMKKERRDTGWNKTFDGYF